MESIFINQLIQKRSMRLYMDRAHPLSTLMVVWLLHLKKEPFGLERTKKNYPVLKYHTIVE